MSKNLTEVAKLLKISRPTLNAKIKKYDIEIHKDKKSSIMSDKELDKLKECLGKEKRKKSHVKKRVKKSHVKLTQKDPKFYIQKRSESDAELIQALKDQITSQSNQIASLNQSLNQQQQIHAHLQQQNQQLLESPSKDSDTPKNFFQKLLTLFQ